MFDRTPRQYLIMELVEKSGFLGLSAKERLIFVHGDKIPFLSAVKQKGEKTKSFGLTKYKIEENGENVVKIKFYSDDFYCRTIIEDSENHTSLKFLTDADYLDIGLHVNENDTVYFEDYVVNGKIFEKSLKEKVIPSESVIFGRRIKTRAYEKVLKERMPTVLTDSDGYYITFFNEPRIIDATEDLLLSVRTAKNEEEILLEDF